MIGTITFLIKIGKNTQFAADAQFNLATSQIAKVILSLMPTFFMLIEAPFFEIRIKFLDYCRAQGGAELAYPFFCPLAQSPSLFLRK